MRKTCTIRANVLYTQIDEPQKNLTNMTDSKEDFLVLINSGFFQKEMCNKSPQFTNVLTQALRKISSECYVLG